MLPLAKLIKISTLTVSSQRSFCLSVNKQITKSSQNIFYSDSKIFCLHEIFQGCLIWINCRCTKQRKIWNDQKLKKIMRTFLLSAEVLNYIKVFNRYPTQFLRKLYFQIGMSSKLYSYCLSFNTVHITYIKWFPETNILLWSCLFFIHIGHNSKLECST